MFWHEENDEEIGYVVPDDIVDLLFSISCRALPVDHAHALSTALHGALPWLAEEEQAALHLIHGADSGNGWSRPEEGSDIIYLSRRTKLALRLPKERLEAASALTGQVLEVAGHRMEIGPFKSRLLSVTTTLYSRYVVGERAQDEEAFLAQAVGELRARELHFKKVLCGRENLIATPGGPLATRSLMVADLSYDDAVRLQQEGIGQHRKLGCGVFIPHKSV